MWVMSYMALLFKPYQAKAMSKFTFFTASCTHREMGIHLLARVPLACSTWNGRSREVAQLRKCLLNMYEVLSSSPQTLVQKAR